MWAAKIGAVAYALWSLLHIHLVLLALLIAPLTVL